LPNARLTNHEAGGQLGSSREMPLPPHRLDRHVRRWDSRVFPLINDFIRIRGAAVLATSSTPKADRS
jgi:hypothetical protein